MSYDLVVRAARAVLPDGERPCAVAVRHGTVAAILPVDAPAEAAREERLAGDEVLLPGLVDTHVHVNEPGRTDWEGFASATAAAAAGGVTTLLDMPLNSIPPTIDPSALERKRAAADGQCAVDVGFWGGAVPSSLGRLKALHELGVFGFKCFLIDSGVPEFPPLSPEQLIAAAAEAATFDGLLAVHAEDPALIRGAPASRRYTDFLRSRPAAAEDAAIETVLRAARETGARMHIVHLSSASAIPLVAQAKLAGVRVTAETCPHYLTLTAEAVPDGATTTKCCPPVRDAASRDALWQGLRDGVIDFVVSDHSPAPPSLKQGDFATAWGGIASVQLGLPLVWTEARRRGHTLADVARWMAQRPAELIGLPGKGRLAPGADADLVALAPDAEFTVEPDSLLHRHKLTPYAGVRLRGQVRTTWLRGRAVTGTPHGRLLAKDVADAAA